MKRTTRRIAAILAVLVCFLWVPTVSATSSVTVTVGTQTARPGDTVTVPVTFTAVEDLVGIELHLGFDETVLEYVESTVEGLALQMNMSSATQAATAPNEVWLSGMTLQGVRGEGETFTITFRVKEGAPDGVSAVQFTEYKHMLLFGLEMTEVSPTLVNGGVRVESEASQESTDAPSDAPTEPVPSTPSDAPIESDPSADADEGGAEIVVDENNEPVTRADGQTVTLSPPNTVVDLQGAQVTDADGNAVKLANVAVMVDQVTAEPTEEVEVAVSLSPIADLTVAEIAVTYDPSVLSFKGGEGVGFMADRLRVREAEAGTVLLQAEYTPGMSGNGKVATLRFEVKDTARAASYRLGLNPSPKLISGQAMLGVQPFAGEIRVLSDGANAQAEGVSPWLIAAAIAGVAVIAAVIVLLRRRKGAPADAVAAPAPRTTDVSGED